jgi:hypothetical protein
MPELGRFQLNAEGSHTAVILCCVWRGPASGSAAASSKPAWFFTALGGDEGASAAAASGAAASAVSAAAALPAPTIHCSARSFADLLPLMQRHLQVVLGATGTKVVVNPSPSVIVLTKGESVPLVGAGGQPLTSICIGLV